MSEARSPLVRLLVLGVRWPPEPFLLQKFQGLAAAGFDVTVAGSLPRRNRVLPVAGVRFIRLPHWKDPRWIKTCDLAASMAKLGRSRLARPHAVRLAGNRTEPLKSRARQISSLARMARLRPDVVHFEWNSSAIDFTPFLDLWTCPTTVSCRGSQMHVRAVVSADPVFRAGLRRSFQRERAIHCVSLATAREAVRCGAHWSKIRVIPPGVDTDFFCPRESRGGTTPGFRIVTVGSFRWLKGHEFALLALRQLRSLGVETRLEIIGRGSRSEWQRLRYTIRDLGISAHVTLRGTLSRSGVRDALQAADAFLLPSLSEGISNAALEAMSCGLPVVVTDCGGMREAVRHNRDGLLVPIGDAAAMAAALARLARSPNRWAMGGAARSRAVSAFTLTRHVKAWAHFYHEASGDGRRFRGGRVSRSALGATVPEGDVLAA